ncbi:VOC family protein [Glutamicibacter soli]|uniref:VOC family protein n=1 Tax=Glutamicibacter soli TaxID=453836 RepID=A0A365YJ61_9MICC|nr:MULTISPECIES: VOC family protein [Micrococcaceae]ALD63286.1 glycosyltransferase [Arthrobacter sp. LS16]ALQ31472.1 glycosyltransferase [Arthrobacter sp. YC-RL1]KLI90044.1 glycosyltransferase [Arthrobacter sp. YC-RL1]NAZ15325.1 VOC family protein [Glutamicibacter soli]RBM02751.1 VOC family protein [Glutamicibacter soli]
MMRLDHVTYACGPDGLMPTAERIAESLGLEFVKGGVHPRFGTRNVIFPLKHNQYLEVVEVLNHPASLKAPFGQAVRARSELGGGWMGWCVSLDDLSGAEERLERKAVPGNRKFPDGRELTWQQIGIKGLIADPQVPYLLRWDDGTEDLHPSRALEPTGEISEINIAGSRERVLEWLGQPENVNLGPVTTKYQAPNGTPGILSVTFNTAKGTVVL